MSERRQLFVLAFDGFRWDFVENHNLRNFQRLSNRGARVPYVKPVFPSLTFPNFYSIATGKQPENHGVVGNRFYDADVGERFSIKGTGNTDLHWYSKNGCEPFWVSAKRRGLTVGSYMWPMSGVQFTDENGTRVTLDRLTVYCGHDKSCPRDFRSPIDLCVDYVRRDRLDLTLLYFDEPDQSAHVHGPEGEQLVTLLRQLDSAVGYLLDKFHEYDLEDHVDLVVLSDHGFAQTELEKRLLLRELAFPFNVDKWEVFDAGSVMTLRLRDGETADENDDAMFELVRKSCNHLQVFRKHEIPERFHLKNSDRSPDAIILCDEHYTIYGSDKKPEGSNSGHHGYDNELPCMRGILYACGPSFRQNFVAPEHTDMVDNYRLLCTLLAIPPRSNDSTNDTIFSLLQPTASGSL